MKSLEIPFIRLENSLEQTKGNRIFPSETLARVVPFVAYLVFITLLDGIMLIVKYLPSFGDLSAPINLWLYPVKVAVVIGCLAYFWKNYDELKRPSFRKTQDVLLSIAVGVVVYLAWVRMDWDWATMGKAAGYDPFQTGAVAGPILAGVRVFGAAVVVPIMEELFWRSFLIRYLISPKFESIPLGTFTLGSFLLTVILFGSEHHLWLAGILAGVAYTLLLYKTRSLWSCIVAHGVTNLGLGIHVLVTGQWQWW